MFSINLRISYVLNLVTFSPHLGGSLTGSGGSSGGRGGIGVLGVSPHRPVMTQEAFDMLEYPFLTMTTFPQGFILHLGKKQQISFRSFLIPVI